jgi:hypothetical protein
MTNLLTLIRYILGPSKSIERTIQELAQDVEDNGPVKETGHLYLVKDLKDKK